MPSNFTDLKMNENQIESNVAYYWFKDQRIVIFSVEGIFLYLHLTELWRT